MSQDRGPTIFAAVAAVGLAIGFLVVKWIPYGSRLSERDIAFGPSLLLAPPVDFAFRYVGGIWPAVVLGLLVATSVETLVPRDWLRRLLGKATRSSAALGGIVALPAMLCSCCAAPVAIGMRRSGVTVGAAMAFWIGSPMLNPAVLAFLLIALPWPYAAVRLVAGLILVFALCPLFDRLVPVTTAVGSGPAAAVEPSAGRWLHTLGRYALTLLPEYLLLVVALGVARAALLPTMAPGIANDPLGLGAAAALGTLFVIPTAGEIPIARALLSAGVGAAPVAALVVTLPAVSLPSLVLMRRGVPLRALTLASLSVALLGIAAGGVAAAVGL
ncbi:MAG: permease [Candidatus Limnocylindria bacterium]